MGVRTATADLREDRRLIGVMRKHGIKYPIITLQEARREGVELAVLCAVLEQETGGGRNVFGHDPTIFRGAGEVTKAKYLAYRKKRGPKGQGGMQGVGPMQLTWYSFQDEADREGGCWKPRPNIRVGARILERNLVKTRSLKRTLWNYNGSEQYAVEVLKRVTKWRGILKRPRPLVPKPWPEPRQGWDSLHPSMHAAYAAGLKRNFTDLGTYVDKPGDHGWDDRRRMAAAFDLGDVKRFNFLGWNYLKARSLAKWYWKHRAELGLEYVILGMRIISRSNPTWHPLTTGDTSHMFHLHASGHVAHDA